MSAASEMRLSLICNKSGPINNYEWGQHGSELVPSVEHRQEAKIITTAAAAARGEKREEETLATAPAVAPASQSKVVSFTKKKKK